MERAKALQGSLPAKRLIVAYIWDWICIAVIAAIGAGCSKISPYHRPFALTDLSLSFPELPSQIPTWLLAVLCFLVPLIVIFLVSLIFVPGRAAHASTPKKLIWRRKLWEWHAGWIGLCLSLALSMLFVQGMKNMFGKPRPDMLARCRPRVDLISQYRVGTAYATAFSPDWALVTSAICSTTDSDNLDEGFRSFPSGHAAYSFGGLFYLSLFLASKFASAFPYTPGRTLNVPIDSPILPVHQSNTTASTESWNLSEVPARNRAAAPPVYLLVLVLFPIGLAIYIASTRFFQFDHHGFDIIIGGLIGTFFAWFSFRWYHMPISGGQGWAWGARTRDRAFLIGVGRGGYVGSEGWSSASRARHGELTGRGHHSVAKDEHELRETGNFDGHAANNTALPTSGVNGEVVSNGGRHV